MKQRLEVVCTTWKSVGATPHYKVLVFDSLVDGNPREEPRVGDEDLKYCLDADYGLGPDVVDSIFRELASSGHAEVWIEAVPA